jgi:hypothetical protein
MAPGRLLWVRVQNWKKLILGIEMSLRDFFNQDKTSSTTGQSMRPTQGFSVFEQSYLKTSIKFPSICFIYSTAIRAFISSHLFSLNMQFSVLDYTRITQRLRTKSSVIGLLGIVRVVPYVRGCPPHLIIKILYQNAIIPNALSSYHVCYHAWGLHTHPHLSVPDNASDHEEDDSNLGFTDQQSYY